MLPQYIDKIDTNACDISISHKTGSTDSVFRACTKPFIVILQYHSFITSHLHACPRMVPRRILRGNKFPRESLCGITRHETYYAWTTYARLTVPRLDIHARLTTRGKPPLDLLYYVWIIHAKLTTCGSLENP